MATGRLLPVEVGLRDKRGHHLSWDSWDRDPRLLPSLNLSKAGQYENMKPASKR